METSKICLRCGQPASGSDNFCPSCGSSEFRNVNPSETDVQQAGNRSYTQNANVQQPSAAPYPQPTGNGQPFWGTPQPQAAMPPAGQYISKRDFRNYYIPSFPKDLRNIAILCYVCVGINTVFALLFNPPAIIDSLLLLGLALGMHLGKSKVCAILLLILGCIEVIPGIILGSPGSGILWLIAGVASVVTFCKADKQYKSFISGN